MEEYIREKIALLRNLGINVNRNEFSGCRNEIQVDQIAHRLIIGK